MGGTNKTFTSTLHAHQEIVRSITMLYCN